MRIGHGFDAHAFQEGGRLVLGGVEISYGKGLAAHSDGDVVLHALCDALLGAAGIGDIGRHFPDSDTVLKGIDSRILLRRTVEKIQYAGLAVGNVDVTVVAQTPKLAPYIEAMNGNIAGDLGVAADAVNIKATTTEGMGFTGRSEGIAAFAVVLLRTAPSPHPT
ncbi:MAG: 2-C-methyl-D-erythritol 2,4-cyclodiphosphate synthase [Gammaproteobacteria bacterium]